MQRVTARSSSSSFPEASWMFGFLSAAERRNLPCRVRVAGDKAGDKPAQTRSRGWNFSCLHHVTINSQCLKKAAPPPLVLSLLSLSTLPRPRRRRPPARPPPSAAGCPTAARQPPAPQTPGGPSTGSPSCSRSASPGRRSLWTLETTRCQLSGSLSAPSWIRR